MIFTNAGLQWALKHNQKRNNIWNRYFTDIYTLTLSFANKNVFNAWVFRNLKNFNKNFLQCRAFGFWRRFPFSYPVQSTCYQHYHCPRRSGAPRAPAISISALSWAFSALSQSPNPNRSGGDCKKNVEREQKKKGGEKNEAITQFWSSSVRRFELHLHWWLSHLEFPSIRLPRYSTCTVGHKILSELSEFFFFLYFLLLNLIVY